MTHPGICTIQGFRRRSQSLSRRGWEGVDLTGTVQACHCRLNSGGGCSVVLCEHSGSLKGSQGLERSVTEDQRLNHTGQVELIAHLVLNTDLKKSKPIVEQKCL